MDSDETQKALKILCDARKSKGDLLNPDDLILEMPLARGKKFGCDAEAVQRQHVGSMRRSMSGPAEGDVAQPILVEC